MRNNTDTDSMNETEATTGEGATTSSEPIKVDNAKAMRILELCSEMRHARQTIESQIRDLRKEAKSKVSALKKAEAALLDQNEDGQLQLFELAPDVSTEVRGIIENPEV